MLLVDRDWNTEWKQLQRERQRNEESSYWDKRAPGFAVRSGASAYAQEFLRRAEVLPGESVLDMGCGPGTLTLPLARQGHHVTAVDFSAGMLALLQKQAAEERLETIKAVHASWDTYWDSPDARPTDMVIASRSLVVDDLRDALDKLDATARRRVCLTLPAGEPPHQDRILFEALGRECHRHLDYIYCVNILFQMGVKPQLSFIESAKRDIYASREEAREALIAIMGELAPYEEQRLERYLDEHLVQAYGADGAAYWAVDYQRRVSWAFVAWEKSERE